MFLQNVVNRLQDHGDRLQRTLFLILVHYHTILKNQLNFSE